MDHGAQRSLRGRENPKPRLGFPLLMGLYLVLMKVISQSPEDTQKLAEKIGQQLKGGEVIELVSDLGGGKTTFVRGLARGTGSSDHVSSPTFTISKVYKSKDLELHHFDFYRLPDPGLMEHEIKDVLDDPHTAIVVEWADVLAHVLPADRLTIHITSTGDEQREFTITCPEQLHYLIENL